MLDLFDFSVSAPVFRSFWRKLWLLVRSLAEPFFLEFELYDELLKMFEI